MKQPKNEKPTLAEAMDQRLKSLAEVRLQKVVAEKNEKFRAMEEEVMEQTHGPNWRYQYAGDASREAARAVPEAAGSEVRLKAG